MVDVRTPLILVVDDDPLILHSITLSLQQEGYDVAPAATGTEALAIAERDAPDLVILDLVLPDLTGVEVCRRLRRTSSVPVLYLSARKEEVDKVVALDAGGDDYVSKPVGLAELVARVRAQLRRGHGQALGTVHRSGVVMVDSGAHRVTVRELEVEVTPREFSILLALIERRGQALSRRDLLERIWGPDWFGDDNVLDVYVRQLRIKIETDPSRPKYIETVRGVGYRFAAL